MLLGIVLCGGQSKRMGSDKGLLTIGASTWAELGVNKLSALGLPVSISVNKTQLPSYQRIFPSTKLTVDTVDARGPLKGILSVHKRFPEDDLLVLACDMINMDHETLNNLVQTYRHDTSFEYYVHTIENAVQPFPAIYNSAALRDILRKTERLQLPSFSLAKIIASSNYKVVDMTSEESFSNYNEPGQLI